MRNERFSKKIGIFLLFLAISLSLFASKKSFAAELFNKKTTDLITQVASTVFADEENVFFASGRTGVIHYIKESGEFKVYSERTGYNFMGDVHAVVKAFGKIWIGASSGINTIDEDGNVNEIKELEMPSVERAGQIEKVPTGSARNMWVRDGYLWVAIHSVYGGLYRYDGKEWEDIRFGKSPFNYTTDIEMVGDDIWYGTNGFGVYIYNKPSRKWKVLNSGSDIAKLPNDTILELQYVDGVMWAATPKFIFAVKRDGDNFEVTSYDGKSTNGALETLGITSMTSTGTGDIIVGTFTGVFRYSMDKWEKLELRDLKGEDINIKRVYAVGNDGDIIWICSDVGLVKEDMI